VAVELQAKTSQIPEVQNSARSFLPPCTAASITNLQSERCGVLGLNVFDVLNPNAKAIYS
jgi:hypothetical protein